MEEEDSISIGEEDSIVKLCWKLCLDIASVMLILGGVFWLWMFTFSGNLGSGVWAILCFQMYELKRKDE